MRDPIQEMRKLAGLSPRLPNLHESRERRRLAEGMSPEEQHAHDAILSAVRSNKLKTKGTWGMRSDILPGGYKTTERVACAVVDLNRTKPHPKHFGMSVPVILASGKTWKEVHADLVKAGEMKAEPKESDEHEETPGWRDWYTHVEEGDLSEAEEMNAEEFKAALDGMLRTKAGDRHTYVKVDSSFGADPTVWVTLINLSKDVVSGPSFGAEGENNRVMLGVDGFKKDGSPASKVRVEARVSAIPREYKLRAKAASPAKIAAYIADFIGKVVKEVPPKYTHTKPKPAT